MTLPAEASLLVAGHELDVATIARAEKLRTSTGYSVQGMMQR